MIIQDMPINKSAIMRKLKEIGMDQKEDRTTPELEATKVVQNTPNAGTLPVEEFSWKEMYSPKMDSLLAAIKKVPPAVMDH